MKSFLILRNEVGAPNHRQFLINLMIPLLSASYLTCGLMAMNSIGRIDNMGIGVLKNGWIDSGDWQKGWDHFQHI